MLYPHALARFAYLYVLNLQWSFSRGGGWEYGLTRAWSGGMRSPLRRSTVAEGTHSLGGSGSSTGTVGREKIYGQPAKVRRVCTGRAHPAIYRSRPVSVSEGWSCTFSSFLPRPVTSHKPKRSWPQSEGRSGPSLRPVERDCGHFPWNHPLWGMVGWEKISGWTLPGTLAFAQPGWHWALRLLQLGL
jgi:hypothetical protein